jgi:hypothetical protein
MPLTLNVGLSRKIGLADYGSLGASCHVTVELDGHLIQQDLEAFHRHVRQAYTACRQAVQEELSRQEAADTHPTGSNGHTNGYAANGNGNGQARRRGDNPRPATASQVRAIEAIAKRQRLDLPLYLENRFRVHTASELSLAEASSLIDELKSGASSNGNGKGAAA